MSELTASENIGVRSVARLEGVWIGTEADLERLDPVTAWRLVGAFSWKTAVVLLRALQGPLLGLHRNELPEALRRALVAEADAGGRPSSRRGDGEGRGR